MKRKIVLTLCSMVLAMPVALAAPSVTTVMSGLDNPRGLAFGPEGALYVVEAGRGGVGPCAVDRGVLFCYGPSGALTRLWKGVQERIVTGLPSYTNPAMTETIGPADVSFLGRGTAFVSIGGASAALNEAAGGGFGTLIQVSASGQWRHVADLAAHEAANNPDGGPIESNPFGVLAEPGRVFVADAAANALLQVTANGTVSTLVVFPARPARFTDSVPTAVERGPDGALYVGELTGVPFVEGAARVYRVEEGQAPSVFAAGFKTIIDLAFGPDGSLYVLQHATGPVFFPGPGQIVRVAPDGSRSVVMGGLSRPTSLAIGPDGALYVSNRGTSVLTGEVLRIVP